MLPYKNDFHAHLEATLAQLTVSQYMARLNEFDDFLISRDIKDLIAVRSSHLKEYQQIQAKTKKHETVRLKVMAVIKYFKFLQSFGVLKEHSILSYTLPKNQWAGHEEFIDQQTYSIIKNAVKELTNIKMKTALSLIVNLGLRGSEVCALKKKDFNTEAQTIVVSSKRPNAHRILRINSKSLCDLLYEFSAGDPEDFLLGISLQTIRGNIQRIVPGISAKDIRNYVGRKLMFEGVSILFVQKYLGHSSLEVTIKLIPDMKFPNVLDAQNPI